MIAKNERIVLTGAAGLVGLNLLLLLREHGFQDIVAIDKHAHNLDIVAQVVPGVQIVQADLAEHGVWTDHFFGTACLVQLHAQIIGKRPDLFIRNNIEATRKVLRAARTGGTRYIVHVSSSVVNSVADDDYTNTKKAQERLVRESGIDYCVLRPTLMFGWFDPKHLGWLARFMGKTPIFPIPGDGRYMRQPLYNRDFCRVILHCVEHEPKTATFDIVGEERVDYIDIIRAIKRVKQLHTPIVCIPYWLFYLLLRGYALFSSKPPFTVDQLTALTAGDQFVGVNMREAFGIRPTPFYAALVETFCHPRYSGIHLLR